MKLPMGHEMDEMEGMELDDESQSKIIQDIIEKLLKIPMKGEESSEMPEGKSVSIEIEKKDPMAMEEGGELVEDEAMKKAKLMAMKGI